MLPPMYAQWICRASSWLFCASLRWCIPPQGKSAPERKANHPATLSYSDYLCQKAGLVLLCFSRQERTSILMSMNSVFCDSTGCLSTPPLLLSWTHMPPSVLCLYIHRSLTIRLMPSPTSSARSLVQPMEAAGTHLAVPSCAPSPARPRYSQCIQSPPIQCLAQTLRYYSTKPHSFVLRVNAPLLIIYDDQGSPSLTVREPPCMYASRCAPTP